jgi:hypothetical protein
MGIAAPDPAGRSKPNDAGDAIPKARRSKLIMRSQNFELGLDLFTPNLYILPALYRFSD